MFVLFDRVARPLCMIFYPAPGCRSALEPHPQGVLLGFSRTSGTPAGTAGHRQFHREIPMPTCWFSTTFSPEWPAKRPVGAVFRCAASRNTQRVSYWGSLRLISNRACGQKSGSASLASHTPSSPNPLGENQPLSSPPLEPRGLLLSVMRQKVGKERSQGVFAPLANPRHFLACPLRKFGPSPTPLRLCKPRLECPAAPQRPRDSTNRNSLCPTKLVQDLPMAGRSPRLRRPATYIASAMIAAPAGSGPKNNQLPFSAQCRLVETPPGKAAIRRSTRRNGAFR